MKGHICGLNSKINGFIGIGGWGINRNCKRIIVISILSR
jgi:hypothetical protein